LLTLCLGRLHVVRTEPYPYLILDARFEKVREGSAARSQAALVAIGINWERRPERTCS
jgi:transposase-like protein